MNHLCHFCTDHIKDPWKYGTIQLVRSVQDINFSANTGCRVCAIFDTYLNPRFSANGKAGAKARIALELIPWTLFEDPDEDEGPEPVDVELKFHFKEEKDIAPLIHDTEISPATGSTSTFDQATAWLRTCITEHDNCRPVTAYHGFRPTRLLQIPERGADKPLKLCDSAMIPPDVPYATLSHCWGQKVPYTLTQSNLHDLQSHGVPESSLSQTFIDAIKITRQLGLDYLWIDSLCIIQDSSDDWIHESSRMHRVYGNSTCNIGATSSQDGSAGCFRRRNPNIIGPLRLELAKGDAIEAIYLVDAQAWRHRFEREPLNTRAWVVQERVLAPRVLHYDRDQLAWECTQLTACERYPLGLGTLVTKQNISRYHLDPNFETNAKDEIPGSALSHIWRPILNAYTTTSITKPGDRLIAIHGLGMRIQETCGWEYIAGMFPKKDLVSQLLWRPTSGSSSSHRPANRIAPSWSWASIEGAITMMPQWKAVGESQTKLKPEELQQVPFCRVIDCLKPGKHFNGDTFLTNHARLKLECYLLPVAFDSGNLKEMVTIDRWQRRDRSRQYSGNPKFAFNLTTNGHARKRSSWQARLARSWGLLLDLVSYVMDHCTWPINMSRLKRRWRESKPVRSDKFSVRIQYDDWDEFWDRSDLWLMPVYNAQYSEAYYFDRDLYGSLEGLVLERGRIRIEEGTYETVFRRCGVFCVLPKSYNSVLSPERYDQMYDLSGSDQMFDPMRYERPFGSMGREHLDEHMRLFWDGVLKFGDVEGVECVRSDKVHHPDFENWEKMRGTYKIQDNIPQYQITLV